MKYPFSLFIVFFLFVSIIYGQEKIEVALEKTTYLVFDSNIEHVDVGSENVSFKIEGSIVKLKAAESNFTDTNMLVYFKGKSKMFFLTYNENPGMLLHEYASQPDSLSTAAQYIPTEFEVRQKELIENRSFELSELLTENPQIHVTGYMQGVSVAIDNIFVDENSFYFRFHFENRSSVAYDIEDIKAMVKSKKKSKSTSLKNIYHNLQIIDSYNLVNKTVRSKAVHNLVIQIEKITLADDEELFWVIEEKGGERKFTLKISPYDLIDSLKM